MAKKLEIIADLKEAIIDNKNAIIKDIVLLSSHSANNRTYTDECQDGAVPLFEEMKCFIGHNVKVEHKFDDLVGRYENVVFNKQDGKTRGDLQCIPGTSLTNKLLSIAKSMPEIIGNSIHASAKYYRKNGQDIITEIVKAYSGDLVLDPATTKGLFEEIDRKETEMELKDLTLELIRENKPNLLSGLDKEIADLKEAKANLEKELDTYKVKEQVQLKKERIQKAITESKLKKELITETFMKTLENAEECEVKAIIEDRMKLTEIGEGVKGNHEKLEDEEITESLEEAIKDGK